MNAFKFDLEREPPLFETAGGTVRFAKKAVFPALDGLSMASIHLHPGAIRIPHWHPNANEMDYVIRGRARIDLFGPADEMNPGGVTEHFTLEEGQISFLPQGWLHSITNSGDTQLHILGIFNTAKSLGITVDEVEALCTAPEFLVP